MHTYIHTYIPTYLPKYIPTYLPTYLHTYIHTFRHVYLPSYIYHLAVHRMEKQTSCFLRCSLENSAVANSTRKRPANTSRLPPPEPLPASDPRLWMGWWLFNHVLSTLISSKHAD